MAKILGIIPARYASTRFPGKPLISIAGKSMIQRVWERCGTAECLSKLVVATDDVRIESEVKKFGGKVLMTSTDHPTGTDRCREALEQAESIFGETFDAVINIQGDEPFVHPEHIRLVASCFASAETQLATLAKKISRTEDLFNPNIIKVVCTLGQEALYFSRSPIPYLRGKENGQWVSEGKYMKHIGIYGYRTDVLKRITEMPPSHLETSESLEQLRWLENGLRIQVRETDLESRSVDSPADLESILNEINQEP
jgi:3-deoxy-manno-octulosonate cytidylyltransferase (CMP-KDO synthetase)